MNTHDSSPGDGTGGGRPTAEEIQRFLAEHVSGMAGLPVGQVDVSAPIASFGIDSVHAIELVVTMEEWLGIPLPDNLPWSHPTIGMIAKELGAGGPPSEMSA
ncbi:MULTISPECIES: acyl carrier protein [unclassified Streptomyces]|uniref:acyl carrier protein n=1 Tax=unclassified Streptomyces TaxID=2593676 RepID=UPI002E767BA3|nr:acyl carrier protein [Streptomyces sp. JV190]MEE1838565.1 acyl carrier protein [Streptomyces sp. JV190]